MNDIDKLLEDDGEEKITIAQPLEVWIDLFLDDLIESGESVRIPSRELHEKYINWVRQIDDPRFNYNIVQFMVRVQNLKIEGIRTGIAAKIKGKVMKCCFFDISEIKKYKT